MQKSLENNNILAILPFDHRTGLYRELGWTEPLSGDQITQMKDSRRLIYDAIRQAVADGIPQDQTMVFTDDVFGAEILADARAAGFAISLTTEKSGTPYFDFEHGEQFADAIESVKPDMVKALVRYNPDGNAADNEKSLANLRKLSDYAHAHGYRFLIEPLVPATDAQLQGVSGDKHRYDAELRPELTTRMIVELQNAGVEPHVWKIEGFEHAEAYAQVVAAARNTTDRQNVGVISLGRNETDEVVAQWLATGAAVPGVIGFAVGRTVFLEALKGYITGAIAREDAIAAIAKKFRYFYDVFSQNKK